MYPFAFDKEEAIKRASLATSIICPAEFVKSLCAYFLGTTPIQPLQVAAVYLPGWIIDAQVQARIWNKKGEEESKESVVIPSARRTESTLTLLVDDRPRSVQELVCQRTSLLREYDSHAFPDTCQVNISTCSSRVAISLF